MPFVRRKRGQVLVVHNRRTTDAKIRQDVLFRFTSPDEVEAVLDSEGWESWCQTLAWRHANLRWDFSKLRDHLEAVHQEWAAEPTGRAFRRSEHIDKLSAELRNSLESMSRARPGDRRVLEVVRPSLADLANTIDQALRRSQDLTTPLQKKKEQSMASEDTVPNEEADDIFDEGMEHWWAGDRRTACRFFRKALKIDSEHADAHNHLGIDLMDKGRIEEAEKHYVAAIEGGERHLVRDRGLVEWGHLENRPYLRALGNLALLLDLRKKYCAAARTREQLLTLNPNDNQGERWLLGEGYHRLDELDDAIAAYERAAEEPGVCFSLALALHEDGLDERVGLALLRAFASNQYIAPMLLGEPWEMAPGWHGTSMAEPEWAADYVERFGDRWREVPDSSELLRRWWHAAPVETWIGRIRELMAQIDTQPPGDDLRSFTFHKLDSLRSEATLRVVASEVEPERFLETTTRRPFEASLDEVHITREDGAAIIEYIEPNVTTTRLEIGPELPDLSDQAVLDMHNKILVAMEEQRVAGSYIAVEIPPGQPQVEFDPEAALWSPRGDVLRCTIEDPDGELGVRIDDRMLTAEEFSKMLLTYAGWGLRIALVPEDELEQLPTVVVREPTQQM